MVRPMRRSVLLSVAVFCPHFNRTVEASLNDAIGRLVHCTAGETCRSGNDRSQPYPAGCPVYPSLTAQA